jgi:hypothetical protein
MPIQINIPITNDTDYKIAQKAILDYTLGFEIPGPTPQQYRVALDGDSRLADNVAGNYTWAGLMGRTDVMNIATAGLRAEEWLAEINSTIQVLITNNIKVYVLQIGKNDADMGRSAAHIAEYIRQGINLIKLAAPDVIIKVLGILPVAASANNSTHTNTVIDQTGPLIYAAVGPDIWDQAYQGMKGSDNALLPTCTDDGSHLNGTGRNQYLPKLISFANLVGG